MTQSNDSILVTPGSGATVATHNPGDGKEYQVVMVADASGHIQHSLPSYQWMVPSVAVGASKLYLDLFNASGSGKVIDIRGIWIVPDTDVAVVGAVAVRIDLYRTSAAGTGGTPAVYKSATPDVAGGCITPFDTTNGALPAQITARHLPTAGATISEWILGAYSMAEESATSMAYMTQYQNILAQGQFLQKLVLREGQGMLLKQFTVASVGNMAFLVAFTLE